MILKVINHSFEKEENLLNNQMREINSKHLLDAFQIDYMD
jgi:hypothetical protein